MKILYCLLFLISYSASAQVQDSISVPETQEIVYDLDTQKSVQQFDAQKIEAYKKSGDFDYTEYQEQDNWWVQLKKWFNQLWRKSISWLFDVDEVSGFWAFILKLLPYFIVIGVLFLLGWLFMKVNPSDMLLEKQAAPQIELTDDEDIIQNQDIEQLIKQAVTLNNYRLAIRYYYLFVLKKLSESELIQWESQKTNTDYTKELNDNTIKNQFKVITRLYDFIWYGSFQVNENSYYQAEKEFQAITHQIKN